MISKGLYRYETFKNDAQDCRPCQQIWDQMRKTDEEQLGLLVSHLRAHLDQERARQTAAA
ncbi:MAG TPA: hypothetical protein VGD07_03990 [Methylomirabilota bacterium]